MCIEEWGHDIETICIEPTVYVLSGYVQVTSVDKFVMIVVRTYFYIRGVSSSSTLTS